jgi:hypothetical protein
MASGPYVFPDLVKLNFFNATALLSAVTTNFRLALLTNAYTPNNATHELFSQVSAAELPTGGGYTAGGGTLTGVVLSQAGGTVKFTSSPFIWTASGAGIPAWRYGYVYYLGTLNAKVNPLVGYFLGDNTPADIPLTTAGNTLTVTQNASGILTAS